MTSLSILHKIIRISVQLRRNRKNNLPLFLWFLKCISAWEIRSSTLKSILAKKTTMRTQRNGHQSNRVLQYMERFSSILSFESLGYAVIKAVTPGIDLGRAVLWTLNEEQGHVHQSPWPNLWWSLTSSQETPSIAFSTVPSFQQGKIINIENVLILTEHLPNPRHDGLHKDAWAPVVLFLSPVITCHTAHRSLTVHHPHLMANLGRGTIFILTPLLLQCLTPIRCSKLCLSKWLETVFQKVSRSS